MNRERDELDRYDALQRWLDAQIAAGEVLGSIIHHCK
jgi:hypothetical protein